MTEQNLTPIYGVREYIQTNTEEAIAAEDKAYRTSGESPFATGIGVVAEDSFVLQLYSGECFRVTVEAYDPAEVKDRHDDPDQLLVRFTERLFEKEPGLRQHFTKSVMFEFAEFVGDKGDVLALIDEYLGSDWGNQQ